MNTKRELRLARNKQKYDNIYVDEHKQMRSNRQNDKLKQLVLHRQSNKRCLDRSSVAKNERFFLFLIVSDVQTKHSYLLHDDQLATKSRNPFNNAQTVKMLETVRIRELTCSLNAQSVKWQIGQKHTLELVSPKV